MRDVPTTSFRRRRVNRFVGLAVAVALVGGLLALANVRTPEPDMTTQARSRGPGLSCAGGSAAVQACAERAVHARALRDHPLDVEAVSCTVQPARPNAFACNVDLEKSCDVYVARYSHGAVHVTHPGTTYCIHEESRVALGDA